MGHVMRTVMLDEHGRKVDVYMAAAREEVTDEALADTPDHRHTICEGCGKPVVVHGPALDAAMHESGVRSRRVVVWCMECLDTLAYQAKEGGTA